MSFAVEHIFPFDIIWTCLLFLFLSVIFRIMSHIFFAGVLKLSLETYCCQDVLLAAFIIFRAFARICLAWIRFSFVGCLLNFCKADFLLFIEFLTSLLNQGLFLFERVEDFGIHFFGYMDQCISKNLYIICCFKHFRF